MLNFNVDPYYDDFDPNNHYHRILFRPGRAVQARELTQSQTILQDQISKFADHIFKQNTPVKGGQVTINNKARYLKLATTYNDNDITASDFLNQIITDATGIVFAKVIATEESVSGDFPTLVVTYFSGREFSAGDLIYSTNSTTTAQIISTSDYTGYSSVASISEGVFYIVNGYSFSDVQNNDGTYSRYSIGNFVSLQPQTIIVQKYGNTPTKRVGLSISEYISDYVTDPALLDPAVGATNYQAPGADRYTITLTLDTKNIALGSDSGFIELVRVTNGNIQRLVDGTVYGVIDDYFAKRTYDTNGDFVVNDFRIVPKANTETTDTYKLQIGTGVAYVRGYRVENALDKTLEANRARTTETINNNITTIDYGSYLYINNANGVFDTTNVTAVDFHCINANSSIVSTNTTTYNATRVATGYLRAVSFDTNTTDANTQTYVYKAYVSDMQNYVLSGTAASGTTSNVVFTDTTGKFSSTANAYYNATITIDAGPNAGETRRVVSYNGGTKTAIVDSTFPTAITSSSTFSLRFDTKDIDLMVVPSGTGASASAGIDPKGKVGSSSIGDTTLFNASSPELVFELGYPYVGNLSDTSYSTFKTFRGISFASGVGSINLSGLDATFFGTASATQSADTAKNYWQVIVTDKGSSAFTVGQIVNFASTNTIVLDSTKKIATLTAGSSTFTGTVLAKVAISNAGTTALTLKRKNLYTANTTHVNLTGTNVSGVRVDTTQAQVYIPYANIVTPGSKQSLYLSDVKRIVKIIDSGTPTTTPTNAMLTNSAYEVTGNFNFDNGQTDTYYGPASITLKNGAPQPKGALLVLLDYYEHGGGDGYFSVNSYLGAGDGGISTRPETYSQIPSYTSKNGTTYNLRDSIDFRLSTVNAQATFQFRYSTTPTTTNTAGAYLPIDLSSFTTDYTHYLGRKDILVLSKDSSFQLITGKASNSPVYPTTPEGALLMANITLDPYTAFLPGETTRVFPNFSLEKVQHRRWTMADISDLQTRINNIEYYTSLSLLEKQAADLQVPDNNGLNRFKNGILVDNFSSFSAADSGNLDFFAKINKRDTTLSATETVFNLPLQSKDILASLGNLSDARQTALNFKYHSNSGGASSLITLPYSSANMVVQKIASNTTSLNPFAVSSDEGILDINPPMDMWVSTSKDPDILITDPNMTIYQAGTTLNQLSATDWQTISGTSYTELTQTGRTATVSNYASQSQQTLSGYYDKVNSLNGTYITDISVQPYIRGQKLIIRAKGMKVNTPVSAYFDGTNVNDYIVQPNIIELDAVNGTFNEGDIVGYYVGSTFTPTARVVSVTKLSPTSIRLYVSSDANSAIYSSSSTMQNAQFNESGTYVGTTANGTYSAASSKQVSLSGKVAGSSGGSSSTLDSGVSYRSGATSITLGPTASATNDFYLGATVKVTTYNQTRIVTTVVVGQQFSSLGIQDDGFEGGWWSDVIEDQVSYENKEETYTATITAYNGTTKVATLDTTVNVSSGQSWNFGDLTSTYTLSGTTFLVAQATASAKVPALSTDEHGNFTGIFSIPSNVFRTGDRVFRVDNRSVVNDPDSATTFAQGVFTASSLATRSQSLNFGATVQAAAKSTVFAQQSQKDKVLINRYSYTLDPVAQSFIIDGATYPNGAFIRSIKVYFKSKPTGTSSVPVKLFITDTTNGYPTGVALDNTVVVKTAQEVVVSDNPQYLDSTSYTEFVFPAPVYIRPNNLYAFVLQTTSPDYTIWIAAQNAIAVPSTVKNLPTDATPTTITKIGGSPYVGALFESQNGITWTADQSKNMMFVIDNCVFDVAASPAVQFVVPKKLPLRKDTVSDIEFYTNANTVPNVSGVYYGKDMRLDAVNMSTTDFTPTSTGISYSYTPTLQSSYVADSARNVIPGKYGTTMSENIYFDDGKGSRVLDSNSATSFVMTGTMTTTDQYVTPVISDDGTSLYAIRFNINDMGLANNNITVTSGNTIGVTANYSSTPPAVTISAPTAIGGTQAFATANLVYNPATTGFYVDRINITSAGSGYIETPTITIASNGSVSATATVSGETSAKGGNGLTRYITKKVVLTPSTDSSDLRVYYTAYKPVGSRVNIYYKVLSRNDTSNFDDQNWVLMTEVGEQPNSFSLSRSDVREYVAAPGLNNQANNQITYTSSSGTTFTSFSQFAIKIVLSTSDTTKAPVINDLRVLALPSGSGY
jgi:hypothetical protein